MKQRPPIHFLHDKDRALRDGDWKLVSFRSQPWQLYRIADDRTEIHDLAAEHPEIVARMEKQWHDMAVNEVLATAAECKPTGAETAAEQHREWSIYNRGAMTGRRDRKKE